MSAAAAAAAAAIASSLVSLDSRLTAPSSCALKQPVRSLLLRHPRTLHLKPLLHRKVGAATSYRSRITVRSGLGDNGRPNTASIFVGGFVLGGLMVGTLACVYAPQISKALAETDRKDLMRKLPKFIYDEEKALEKTRKVLTEKIAQLNAAIDDVSSQLRADDGPNGVASDEVEAAT